MGLIFLHSPNEIEKGEELAIEACIDAYKHSRLNREIFWLLDKIFILFCGAGLQIQLLAYARVYRTIVVSDIHLYQCTILTVLMSIIIRKITVVYVGKMGAMKKVGGC